VCHAAAKVVVPVGHFAGIRAGAGGAAAGRLQLALPAVIKAALRRREFFLAYQPLVDLRTGQWVGAEALIRWQRPGGENVRPDLFIPVAEESGLIQAHHAAGRRSAGRRTPRDSSAATRASTSHQPVFHRPAFRPDRPGAAAPGGGDRGRRRNLMVEVTERGFTDPKAGAEALRALRAAGIRVAIDDFGTATRVCRTCRTSKSTC